MRKDKPIAKIKEKTWTKEMEVPIYVRWRDDRTYKFVGSDKKVYSIDTPPPYVNTPIHIGHATTYVLMDMFARFKRMRGFNVIFPLGLDRNGIPIEMAAEKRFKISLKDTTREEFIRMCHKILEETSTESMDSFLKLGISFNSWEFGQEIGDAYMTDSEEYRTLTQATFIDLWKKNLIYEDARINNFCPGCGTTLADAEVIYKELPTVFNDVVFRVKETDEEIIIGTTRPELICTCGMVIFNPEDKRHKHLDGKTAITPLFEKEVPIRAHPMAEIEKGTGLVMMCSAGDQSDIRFFREMNLDPVIAIGADGKMNEHAEFLKGLSVEEARRTVIEKLKAENLLVDQKRSTHRTPVCERSNDPIEFIAMPELYVKQIEFKEKMKEIANKVNFYAPQSRQILLDWVDAVSIDWPISRRRYYATEVPLWYCKKCDETIVPEKGKYYRPWKEAPPVKECPNCGSHDFRGDERVFDTWFDSSISALYILKWNSDFFKMNSPCTLRPQGKEIVRNWLYYTLLKCYLLTGDVIFRDVWINYHIVDDKGHKMSKSVGNIINPKDIIEKFGAEPFRFWSAIEGNLEKTDFRCSHDRIQGAGKTLTKIWNISKFISMFPEPKYKPQLQEADRWIIQEINEIIKFATERYENYDFHNPSVRIKNFIWETFASHYIELVKNRAYNQRNVFSKDEEESALWTLHLCLKLILKMLAPVVPFLTHKVYKDIYTGDVHASAFPIVVEEYKVSFTTDELMDLNSVIWKAKKDRELPLNSEINKLEMPWKFKPIEKDLREMHKIKEIVYSDEINIEF